MTIQTIEIHGERYVLLSERDFLTLTRNQAPTAGIAPRPENGQSPFREVVPLRVGGTPASELLLKDRR
jgi:hypothetical protein